MVQFTVQWNFEGKGAVKGMSIECKKVSVYKASGVIRARGRREYIRGIIQYCKRNIINSLERAMPCELAVVVLHMGILH